MIRNYLMTAFRNIKRRKLLSSINIFGLALGMASFILIFLWCSDELGYESFNKNANEIYRIIANDYSADKVVTTALPPNPIGPALKEEYPEVVNTVRYTGGFKNWLVEFGEKSYTNDRFGATEPAFFEMFSFPFLIGDPKTALAHPSSIVLTESMALKYFNSVEGAMNQILRLNFNDFKVTGVLKDVPHNTHMQFDFLIPIVNMQRFWATNLNDWNTCRMPTYIQIRKDASVSELNKKISDIVKKHRTDAKIELSLQALTDVHLRSNLDADDENIGKGSIVDVRLFSIVAFLILIIACINFTNLSTANAGNRAKEIGLRKTFGAARTNIISQFLGESILMAFIALWFAVILCYLFLPIFNNITDKSMTIGELVNLPFIGGLILLSVLVGIMAGSYPAIFISSFKPIKVLKESASFKGRGSGILFKILVGTQLVLTIILILLTTVVYNQLQFIKNKDLGYDKSYIIHMQGSGLMRTFEPFREVLLRNPNIKMVSIGSFPNQAIVGDPSFFWEGRRPDDGTLLHPMPVGYDYLETFKLKMVEGRFFSQEFPTDAFGFVLNETAVKVMGLSSPVGKRIRYTGYFTNQQNPEGTIIGVVKDFHVETLHNPIKPFVLIIAPQPMWVYIKLNAEDIANTIEKIKATWKKFSPYFPFSYEFLDESLNVLYASDQRLGDIFKYFTILAIFISGLGLFGLSSFMSQQRTKEIGIRKVLGSSVFEAVMLLLKEFMKWVLIAMVISLPIGWYFSNKWLENFAYRIHVEWWMFLFASGVAVIITIATVIYSTIKVSRTNPSETLKYE